MDVKESSKEAECEEVTEIEIPLEEGEEEFDLTKTVCSHGLFMMSPNKWDPLSRTLTRPLHLNPNPNSHSHSLMVSVSHPNFSLSLLVRVHGTRSLSEHSRLCIVAQVVRMLRLSDSDERRAGEFRRMVGGSEDGQRWLSSFGGRPFRSPTLFEDMVKCILLCNCQWSRTLTMAEALCELQLELQSNSSNLSFAPTSNVISTGDELETDGFKPNPPLGNESKRKLIVPKVPRISKQKFNNNETDIGANINSTLCVIENISPNFSAASCTETYSSDNCGSFKALSVLCEDEASISLSRQSNHMMEHGTQTKVGNFPSPIELSNLDEQFLANRCNLGYRAGRLIKLAKGIIEGSISLRELEEICDVTCSSTYHQLVDKLTLIDGFGPFTCANVLMCMGFYHVIPCDSETVRHLKQVHGRKSTIQTVQRDVEKIYKKYAPFQFLAYWAELWYCYEQKFGKLSEMPCSGYKVFTASNIRRKANHKNQTRGENFYFLNAQCHKPTPSNIEQALCSLS